MLSSRLCFMPTLSYNISTSTIQEERTCLFFLCLCLCLCLCQHSFHLLTHVLALILMCWCKLWRKEKKIYFNSLSIDVRKVGPLTPFSNIEHYIWYSAWKKKQKIVFKYGNFSCKKCFLVIQNDTEHVEVLLWERYCSQIDRAPKHAGKLSF